MAEKFTILPNFAQQESNTAVLQDGGFADELLTSMRTKRVVDDAKHEKAQQELASSINFKTGDIFDVDLNVINKQKQDYLDWISANSEKIASHDLATLAKQKEWKGKIDMQVDKAIGRKQWYDKQTIYLTSPDGTKLGYGKQGDFDKLKKYKETALGEWEGYDKRNMFNEYDFFEDYNIQPQERVDDNGVTKITYSQTPAEDIVTVGQQKINSPQGREYIEYYLDLANAANNGQTVDATIEYYDIEDFKKNGDKATVKTIQLKYLTPDNIESVIFFKKNALDKAYQNSTKKDVNAPSSSGGGSGGSDNKPITNWVADLSYEIQSGTLKGGVGVVDSATGKKVGTRYDMPSDFYVGTTPEKKERVLGVYVNDKGEKYLIKESNNIVANADGTYTEKKKGTIENANNRITSFWTDVIAPYYRSTYGTASDTELEKFRVDLWTNDPQKAKELGIPKPINFKDNTSTTTNNTNSQNTGGVQQPKQTNTTAPDPNSHINATFNFEDSIKNPNGTKKYKNYGFTHTSDTGIIVTQAELDKFNGMSEAEKKKYATELYKQKYEPTVKDLPTPLKLVAGDFNFNSENPYPSLMVAAGIIDVDSKRKLYTKENGTTLRNYKVSDADKKAIIDAYNKDPKGFLDKFDAERKRSYSNTSNASKENIDEWVMRVDKTREEANKLLNTNSTQSQNNTKNTGASKTLKSKSGITFTVQ